VYLLLLISCNISLLLSIKIIISYHYRYYLIYIFLCLSRNSLKRILQSWQGKWFIHPLLIEKDKYLNIKCIKLKSNQRLLQQELTFHHIYDMIQIIVLPSKPQLKYSLMQSKLSQMESSILNLKTGSIFFWPIPCLHIKSTTSAMAPSCQHEWNPTQSSVT
jgi:hypothetical protein